MKKYSLLALLMAIPLLMTACFDDLSIRYDGPTQVEFESAVRTSPAVGRTYPLISTSNSTTAGPTVTSQLNLVGPQRTNDLTVRVLVDPTLTTASVNSYTLLNGGSVVIPANSSVASLSIAVARASSTTAALGALVIALDSTSSDFKASPNYKRIGFTIRQ